jgi:hypothetical protein
MHILEGITVPHQPLNPLGKIIEKIQILFSFDQPQYLQPI